MSVRLKSTRCTELKPHPSGEPVKCFWRDSCRVLVCYWAHWHQLPPDSPLRVSAKAKRFPKGERFHTYRGFFFQRATAQSSRYRVHGPNGALIGEMSGPDVVPWIDAEVSRLATGIAQR